MEALNGMGTAGLLGRRGSSGSWGERVGRLRKSGGGTANSGLGSIGLLGAWVWAMVGASGMSEPMRRTG